MTAKTPRTMTASEALEDLRGSQTYTIDWINSLAKDGGTLIVPDPEPRPKFECEPAESVIAWIGTHGNNDDVRCAETIVGQLDTLANAIADRLGMK